MMIVYGMPLLVDWNGGWRLLREQHARKAPQERSDEEIGAVPAESVHLERKIIAEYFTTDYLYIV